LSGKFSDFQEKFVDIKFSEFVRKFFRTQIFFLIGLSPGPSLSPGIGTNWGWERLVKTK
jgi:hypothetical protein